MKDEARDLRLESQTPLNPPVNGGRSEQRNLAIRRRWRELRDGKVRPRDAIVILAEEFHLSDKRIDAIVYETQRNGGGQRDD